MDINDDMLVGWILGFVGGFLIGATIVAKLC